MTDGRLFVVGDIHGCLAELETLLGGLPLAAGDTVCFLGDYIDRGRESKGVIDYLLAFRRRDDVRAIFLKGNHEDMCLDFLGRAGHWGEAWLANGGAAAVRSYGVDARSAPSDVAAAIPAEHLEFLETLERFHRCPDYLLVHAGIRPERPMAEQTDEDIFWIREDFIRKPHALPETVVFGHTPVRQVLVDLPYKIGIDTGCVYGGSLTALELPAQVLHQVQNGERRVRTSQLAAKRRWFG